MTIESDSVSAAPPLLKRQAHDTTSPAVRIPSRIGTPPPPSNRETLQVMNNVEGGNSRNIRHGGRRGERTSIGGIDPDGLTRALSRELSADRRDSASLASPSRKRQRINGDRLVKAHFYPF